MTNIIYSVLGIISGAILGAVATYVIMHDRYAKQHQQKRIGCFVARMKRLKEIAPVYALEKSISTFAQKCIEFSAESFHAFKTEKFDEIARVISTYETQKYLYQNGQYHGNQEDLLGTMRPTILNENYQSKEELSHKIESILHKIIGIWPMIIPIKNRTLSVSGAAIFLFS